MILKNLAASALAVFMLGSTAGLHAQYAQGPPPPGYDAHGDWENPPREFNNEAMRKGFHDGIEGARKDYQNHRQPNVNNRDEYRHPDVPHDQRRDYRAGFQRGYQVGVQNIMNGRR